MSADPNYCGAETCMGWCLLDFDAERDCDQILAGSEPEELRARNAELERIESETLGGAMHALALRVDDLTSAVLASLPRVMRSTVSKWIGR